MPFLETSAYTDDNVSLLFSTIAKHVLEANRSELSLERKVCAGVVLRKTMLNAF